MASEIDGLQERVEAICATGDSELAHMTFLLLGRELRAFFNKKHKRKNFKRFHYPFTQAEVDWKLADLAEAKSQLS
jgi:hypothetical protein